ncbi:MAG: TonB-dependent receptor [Candidatus Omnitrophica bacterium]|nr:TonB-dependent receptor [Candidatus Omnitrophota bacterium]
MMKKIILSLTIIYCLMQTIAYADEEKPNILKKLLETAISPIDTILGPITELERIVVTPSRVEEKLGASSSSISVIDGRDFDRRKIDTTRDALRGESGIDIVQSGAFQGTTSIFTRGGNSNHTLIMIDGVKAYDPISPNGAYNLAHLTLDNIDRIEILRGPQSALYGSDAMAGVVNIISKKPEMPYVNASYEAGSFFTYKEDFEAGANTKGFHYSIAASRLDTKGISQLQAKNNNQERDPYERTAVATRIDYDIGDIATIGGTLRYTNARYQYDDSYAGDDDDNSVARHREAFLTNYIEHRLFDWWKHSIHLGWMSIIRQNFDDDPPASDYISNKYTGKYFKLDYTNSINIMELSDVVIGYDYVEEIGDNYKDFSHTVYDQP